MKDSIKVLMFDIYGTLATWVPSRDVVQLAALGRLGINSSKEQIDRGYGVADAYMAKLSLHKPLRSMNSQEKEDFFAEFERVMLGAAGINVDLDLARRIWGVIAAQEYSMGLFDDVIENLDSLRLRGYKVGIVSNMNITGARLAEDLGLTGHIDFALTSEEADSSKPDPGIFIEALRRAGNAAPEETVMIGDQPSTDMDGADAAGLHGVLLDRYEAHLHHSAHPRVNSMEELCRILA